MAEGGQISESDRLNCSICLEPFKQPKLLPCHHSFCAVCLEDYIERTSKNGKFECPLCRRSADVPSNGVEGFQSNFYIESGGDAIQSTSVPCDICGLTKKAEHRCLDCEENFCDSCTTSHMKMKMSRHHKMEDLTTTCPSKRKIIAREFCQKHPSEEIKVICKDCNVELCLICSITNHQNHTSRDIPDEAKELRDKLASALEAETVKESIAALRKNLETGEEYKKTLSECRRRDLQEVDAQEREFLKDVKAVAEEFRKDINEKYKAIENKNVYRLRTYQTKYQFKSSLMKKMEVALNEENDFSIVKMRSTLQENITSISDQEHLGKEQVVALPKQNVFQRRQISKDALTEMFGKVLARALISRTDTVQNIKPKLVSEFTRGNTYVYGIATISDQRAWVSSMSSSTLRLVHVDGSAISAMEMPSACETIASSTDGTCFVSCPKSKRIYSVTITGDIQTVITVQNGDLLHGVACSYFGQDKLFYTSYNKAKKIHCVKVVMSHKYVHHSSEPFGEFPSSGDSRIAVDFDCVCITNRMHGFIKVLDHSGKSTAHVDKDKNFGPLGVCFDHDGFILVACCNSNKILRFSQKGELLQVLLQNLDGPRSVAVDEERRLWVGLNAGKIKIFELV